MWKFCNLCKISIFSLHKNALHFLAKQVFMLRYNTLVHSSTRKWVREERKTRKNEKKREKTRKNEKNQRKYNAQVDLVVKFCLWGPNNSSIVYSNCILYSLCVINIVKYLRSSHAMPRKHSHSYLDSLIDFDFSAVMPPNCRQTSAASHIVYTTTLLLCKKITKNKADDDGVNVV